MAPGYLALELLTIATTPALAVSITDPATEVTAFHARPGDGAFHGTPLLATAGSRSAGNPAPAEFRLDQLSGSKVHAQQIGTMAAVSAPRTPSIFQPGVWAAMILSTAAAAAAIRWRHVSRADGRNHRRPGPPRR